MVNIYVLKLENGKYYVGKTNHTFQRFNQHSSGKGAKWTKKHSPIDLLHWYPDMKDVDENKITIQIMREYGVKNVRGGSWTKVEMTGKEISNLEKRIHRLSHFDSEHAKKCTRCGRASHTVSSCYARFHKDGTPLEKRAVTSKDATKFISNYQEQRTDLALKDENLNISDVEKEVEKLTEISEDSFTEMIEIMQSYSEEENRPFFGDAFDNTHYLVVTGLDNSLRNVVSNASNKVEKRAKNIFSKIDKKGQKVGFYGTSMPGDAQLKKIWSDVNNRLCKELKDTFSQLDAAGWVSFFVDNKVVTIIQHSQDMSGKGGKGKNIRIYNGSLLGALFRRAYPAKSMAKKVMKRMVKNGYDNSKMKLIGIQVLDDGVVNSLAYIERLDKTGNVYEKSFAIYRLVEINEIYYIQNMELFEDLNNPPEGMDLKDYWRPKDYSFESLVGTLEKKVLDSIAGATIKAEKEVMKAVSKIDKKAKGLVKGAKKKLGLK